MANDRPRARDLGIQIGELPPGPLNAIVDVPGVRVGHVSLIEGDGATAVRTGVTAIVPHGRNVFTARVRAAAHVINGFGKSVGLPQVVELGEIETPILLTNTLSVWAVADALAEYMAERNPGVYSFNPVVRECNDARLNDVLGRHVKPHYVRQALETATTTGIDEGNVGAGVGMSGFGWKAGIGTASRLVDDRHTVGVLVLTNTGAARDLRIDGVPVGRHLRPPAEQPQAGSIIIVIATDSPLESRQLLRIAKRASFGLARVGGIADHGSGDFVIAFTTANQIGAPAGDGLRTGDLVPEAELSRLFRATIEATEEAIVNSILRAETLVGRNGTVREGIPIEELRRLLARVQDIR